MKIVFTLCSLWAAVVLYALSEFPATPGRATTWQRFDGTSWKRDGGVMTLVVDVPADRANGMHVAILPLDLAKSGGQRFFLDCMIRGSRISKPDKPWLGVKFMVEYTLDGKKNYIDSPMPYRADFDWSPANLEIAVPKGVEDAKLVVGLQNASGRVQFKNVRVRNFNELKPEEAAFPRSAASPTIWSAGGDAEWIFSPGGSTVLKISVPPEKSNGMHGVVLPLNLSAFKGRSIAVAGMCRGENLSKPDKPWLGVKFMVEYFNGAGMVYYDARRGEHQADFGWKRFNVLTPVNAAAGTGRLTLGLQNASGTVYFKDIRIFAPDDIFKPPFELPSGFRCEYSAPVKAMARLRGVMSPDVFYFKPDGIGKLGEWHVNAVRLQLMVPRQSNTSVKAWREYMLGSLDKLDTLLPQLKANGISVILDMHNPPGDRYNMPLELGTANDGKSSGEPMTSFRIFNEDEFFNAFIRMWREIAARYKDEPGVVAYDVLNEPSQETPVERNYLAVQYEAAKAIRAIDPERPVIINANNWSIPAAFGYLKPLPLKNIFYQVHMYLPGSYTHQGVGAARQGQSLKVYPGVIDGIKFDRARLREELDPVVKFQKKYGARIFVGEFSVTRWSPGGAAWLADVLSLFEEFGWDWTYHAFREYHGWSVEHDEDPAHLQQTSGPTDRQRVLLQYFNRNTWEE
ncbi:MAG: cellulase family glycosylhydrolase [Victivallaceae bacterium]|nr:cellulase family glycosylhydrolase [Victivallaceae bacterium]